MLSLILLTLVFSGSFNILLSERVPETRLIHLQCLFRHGDRAPVIEYSYDPDAEDNWPNGSGELTQLGKRQHFTLGRVLRKLYRHFITSNPSEVRVHSSQMDRCLVSAEMNLASFFAPTTNWTVVEGLPWQPIPIYYKPKKEDKYLYPFHDCPCAAKANLLNYVLIEDEVKVKYKGFFENVTRDSGLEIKNFEDLLFFADVFYIRKKYNLTIPSWVENHWVVFDEITEKYISYYSNSPVLQKLRGGPFLKKLIEIMILKIKGQLKGNKVAIYSSHDIVLSTVLAAAGLWNGVRPPYCATVLFELHERIEDKTHLVRFLYLNSTEPELGRQKIHILKVPGHGEFCPLEDFINHTKHLISENWEHDCKVSHESENEYCGEEWFEEHDPL